MVKSILKINVAFILPFFVFLIIGGLLLVTNSKANLHLTFNAHHTTFFDTFFYYITYLGDGVVPLFIVLLFLFVKYRYAILVAISNIIASTLTQVLKNTLFDENLRPKKFFENVHDLYLVPGVNNYFYNSFPSGHATTAFSLYFGLALIVKNNFIKLLFFITALLIAYSRVYLSQHFFEDIYVGALIGVIITFVTYVLLEKSSAKWLNSSLISSFKYQ